MSFESGLMMGVAQLEPTRLFMPEAVGGSGGVVEAMTSFPVMLGMGVVFAVLMGVWLRAMSQRKIDPRELAFRSMARRLKLSHKEIVALRAMSQAGGLAPVGLVMSPSAVRRVGAAEAEQSPR